jgi:catechol 2,3-dioxygenase-like lactoylglutathione lyase family enzyme
MEIKKLDHSAPVVADLERARWFYGAVLGLQEIPGPGRSRLAAVQS